MILLLLWQSIHVWAAVHPDVSTCNTIPDVSIAPMTKVRCTEDSSTCGLVNFFLKCLGVLSADSDLVRIFTFWVKVFVTIEVLHQHLVNVEFRDGDSWQDSFKEKRGCFEAIFASMHVGRTWTPIKGLELHHHRHAHHVEFFVTVRCIFCIVQLVSHAFSQMTQQRKSRKMRLCVFCCSFYICPCLE